MKVSPATVRPLVLGLVLALGVGAAGCQDRKSEAAMAPAQRADAAAVSGGAAAPQADGSKPLSASRALKITTETTVASRDVMGTVEALRKAVAVAGGYVSDARTGGTSGRETADLEARVPVERLAAFREAVGASGDVVSESEKAEDVTEQRADLKARLRNARTQEKRLLDLLSDRTGSLADVIAAEKALSEVRDQIERLEAQDTVLEGQIALATVKLHVVPKGEPVAALSVGDRLIGAGRRGVDHAGSLLMGLVVGAATMGPSLVVLALIGLAFVLIARKVARKLGYGAVKAAPMGAPAPMAYAPAVAPAGQAQL
jgi:hypothetical protein